MVLRLKTVIQDDTTTTTAEVLLPGCVRHRGSHLKRKDRLRKRTERFEIILHRGTYGEAEKNI